MSRFVDLDINFDRNPFTGDVMVRRDEEAVKRSLRNLLSLNRNDKPFHPEIYSGIRDLLFDPADNVMAIELKSRISQMIQRYEPRISKAVIDIVQVIDQNEIVIGITFTIANAPTVYNTTLTLERLR